MSIFVRGYRDFLVVVLQAGPALELNASWTRVTTGITELDIAEQRERIGRTVAMGDATPHNKSQNALGQNGYGGTPSYGIVPEKKRGIVLKTTD
jgi:hypothetical protein